MLFALQHSTQLVLKMILKFILTLFFIAICDGKSYDDYKVYSVVPENEVQVQILNDLRKHGYDIWTDSFNVGNDVRIMVAPANKEEFVNYTESVGLNAVLSIDNVQELINQQLKPAAPTQKASLGSFTWTDYHTLTEIHDWLDELEQLYPNVVTTITVGTTFEGRPIKGVIINFNPEGKGDNPLTGMIEGGIHAREWISPATVTWIIKEFLTSTDAQVRFLAETFVWHIFPIINPDGYSYTFTNDRLWRKNRNTANYVVCGEDTDIGNGIDLNRNFDFLWMTIGASNNSCALDYAGPSPASELETQAISNYVRQLKQDGNLIYYFAFHSYSQMVLVPHSHLTGYDVLDVGNYGDMYEVAIRGAQKLTEVHGTAYTVGTSAEILYAVSGSSFDWVKGVVDVPIAFLFELRDVGQTGFLLPPEQIIPNSEEIMACLLEMDRTTRLLGYYTGAATAFASTMSVVVSFALLILFK